MSRSFLIKITALACALMAASLSVPASAQATRTWVSGVGDDANPCSRTAPCKTFAGAISKTAAGGEINGLDPGAYGALTITKSIAIICQYTQAGMLATGGISGININAAATDVIYLSGLDLNGSKGAGSIFGLNGIRILAAGTVHIENSIIRDFRATDGLGIRITPTGLTQITVTNVTISDNGTGATGGGILIQPSGATGAAQVILRNVRLQNNANNALRIDTTGNTGGGVHLLVEESQFTGSGNGINVLAPASTTTVRGIVRDSLIAYNSSQGWRVSGSTVQMASANNTITANGTGVIRASSAILNSFGNNQLEGNTTDGAFTSPVTPEE
jgi:hypothetical protein